MNMMTTVGQRLRKRHWDNPQLRLWYETLFHFLPVQTAQGPLITNYLETAHHVLSRARASHCKIMALPLTLRYPASMPLSDLTAHNTVMNRFLSFLRWELDHLSTSHPVDMRYLWCREQVTSHKPHYHVILLFNGNALSSLGTLKASTAIGEEAYSKDCMYHRLVRAWEWAISWPAHQMQGLVDMSEDNITDQLFVYHFHRDDQNAFQQLFYAASYLCKAYTKPIGQGMHCFEGSRL